MKNIESILKEAGIELTDEQKEAIRKEVAANYKTIADYEKQTGKLSELQTQYNTIKTSLDKFDGVDLDDLKSQIETAKKQASDAEENAKKQLAARDYSDAVKEAISNLKFSSKAAEKQFITDLTAQNLPIKDGKLLGLNDYITSYKASDAGAILDAEAEEKKATFTQPTQPGTKKTTDPRSAEFERKLAAVMGVAEKD